MDRSLAMHPIRSGDVDEPPGGPRPKADFTVQPLGDAFNHSTHCLPRGVGVYAALRASSAPEPELGINDHQPLPPSAERVL